MWHGLEIQSLDTQSLKMQQSGSAKNQKSKLGHERYLEMWINENYQDC